MPIVLNTNTKESERDLWRTPPVLFRLLNDGFNFHLDAAANHENALCPQYYTIKHDALSRPWFVPDEGITRVFCNPPFSRTGDFLAKGNEEAEKGALVVFLVRADAMETDWWTDNVVLPREGEKTLSLPRHFVHILKPRVPYVKPDGMTPAGPPFATAVVTMMPPSEAEYVDRVMWWWWKEEAIAKGHM